MKLIPILFLLASPALADDWRYLGTLNASSGATTNNADAACTTPTGSTAALGSFGGTAQRPVKLFVQCDVDVRMRTSTSSSAAASNTRGANFGWKLAADQLFSFDLKAGYVAYIPASGSGSAHCDFYSRS